MPVIPLGSSRCIPSAKTVIRERDYEQKPVGGAHSAVERRRDGRPGASLGNDRHGRTQFRTPGRHQCRHRRAGGGHRHRGRGHGGRQGRQELAPPPGPEVTGGVAIPSAERSGNVTGLAVAPNACRSTSASPRTRLPEHSRNVTGIVRAKWLLSPGHSDHTRNRESTSRSLWPFSPGCPRTSGTIRHRSCRPTDLVRSRL